MAEVLERKPVRTYLKERETLIPRKKLVDVFGIDPLVFEQGPVVDAVSAANAIEVVAGCLPKDVKILTNPNEFKTVDELSVGSTVFTVCGERKNEIATAKVVNIWSVGTLPVYKLTVRPDIYTCKFGSLEIEASPNHRFLVRKKGYYKKWVLAEQLEVGDRIAVLNCLPYGTPYPLPNILNGAPEWTKVSIPQFTNERLMWLFGYWVGDGYLKQEEVVFCAKKDPSIADKISESVSQIFSLKGGVDKDRIRVHSKYLVKLWKALGFYGHAHAKRVPTWVFTTSPSERIQFILGYTEADGSKRTRDSWRLTSVNFDLLNDTKTLAQNSGFVAYKIRSRHDGHIPRIQGRIIRSTMAYDLTIRFIGTQPIRYDRLLKKDSIGYKECFDIEVSGRKAPRKGRTLHSFIANGFVVHNSSWARGLAEGVCGIGYVGFSPGTSEFDRCVFNVSHKVAARVLGMTWVPPTPLAPPPRPPRRR